MIAEGYMSKGVERPRIGTWRGNCCADCGERSDDVEVKLSSRETLVTETLPRRADLYRALQLFLEDRLRNDLIRTLGVFSTSAPFISEASPAHIKW